jgi:hypothetical protein
VVEKDMLVFFGDLLVDPDYEKKMPPTLLENRRKLEEFVRKRLKPLKKKIEKEEEEATYEEGGKSPATVIFPIEEKDSKKLIIRFHDYSPELIEEMQQCIPPSAFGEFHQEIIARQAN